MVICSFVCLFVCFSEVNSGFFYKSAAEREKLVQAERAFTDARVAKVIALKKQVCEGNDRSFVVINQKVSVFFQMPGKFVELIILEINM